MFNKKDIDQLKNDLSALKTRVNVRGHALDDVEKQAGETEMEVKKLNEKVNLILAHLGLEYCEGHERRRVWNVKPQLRTRHTNECKRGRKRKNTEEAKPIIKKLEF